MVQAFCSKSKYKSSQKRIATHHLIKATTVDVGLLVGGAKSEDLRQGGRRRLEGRER